MLKKVMFVLMAGVLSGMVHAAEMGAASAIPAQRAPEIINPVDTKLVNKGKILEVIDTPTYTYLKVSGKKQPVWIAAYKAEFTKGATVKYSKGSVQTKFYSKTLDRTFDSILFVDSIEQVK